VLLSPSVLRWSSKRRGTQPEASGDLPGLLYIVALAMPEPRRFPPPWTAEPTPNCFIVRDADGQQLAYVYYENEPGRR